MKGSVHKDDLFIVHDALVLMKEKEKINWMIYKGWLHIWFIPLNGLQDRTPYVRHTVGNSPKFMPLNNSLNREILHSLCFHSVLRCYILDGEGTDNKERIMRFSYSTPREIAWGLKRVWDSKIGGMPSSERIVDDIYRALEALLIVFRANGAAVEGITDRNGHRSK